MDNICKFEPSIKLLNMYFLSKYKRGVFNKYQKGMPVLEMFAKDVSFLINKIWFYIQNKGSNKTIFVYPHYPSRGSTLYKISKLLNHNIVNKFTESNDLIVYWEYLTFRQEFELMDALSESAKVVNLYSRDISKIFVDKVFANVFGYSTIVNPLVYKGMIVKKNDINAKHDGNIIEAPINRVDEGYIYQILIDNTINDDLVKDYRVVVVGEVVDFVYVKYRNVKERFKNTSVRSELKLLADEFTEDEIARLNRFCKEMGLDYGELDVLRHAADGKIYVVDVNNTPQGPPAHIPKKDGEKALKMIADSFKNKYL